MSLRLPAQTRPWSASIPRRHQPEGSHLGFKACLRWEFGFGCALCLLHESDLRVPNAGLMSVEHYETQSSRADLIDEYDNCIYACRFCNGARGKRPAVSGGGARLLDPCRDVWAAHFEAANGSLLARDLDEDARYTADVYALNDERKRRLRFERRRAIDAAVEVVTENPRLIERLLALVEGEGSEARRQTILDAARTLERAFRDARAQLRLFAAIPPSRPQSCACGLRPLTLPATLSSQCVPLDEVQ